MRNNLLRRLLLGQQGAGPTQNMDNCRPAWYRIATSPWPWIFALALALRLAFFRTLLEYVGPERLTSLSTDMTGYYYAAQSIYGNLSWSSPAIMMFGPGYPTIIAVLSLPFGQNPSSIIIGQIILGSVGSALQGYLGFLLTDNRRIGIITGLLSSCSVLSIAYASFLWSETVFVLMLQVALILLIKARSQTSIWPIVISGFLLGVAVLTRSVAQILPLLLAGWAYWWYRIADSSSGWFRRRAMIRVLIISLIPVMMAGGWTMHNKSCCQVNWLAMAGPVGMGKAVRLITSHTEGISYEQADSVFWNQVTSHKDFSSNNYRVIGEVASSQFLKTALNHPLATIYVLGKNAIHNVTVDSTPTHLPTRSHGILKVIADVTSIRWLNLRTLVLAIIGLTILLARRRFAASVLMGGICLYFGIMSAFALNQGSRIFFPAHIASSVLVAVVLNEIFDRTRHLIRRNNHSD